MDLELNGKVAWVTGGSGGLGGAIARELLAEGCELAITGRNQDRLGQAARALADQAGRDVLTATADTADEPQVRQAAERIVAALGQIDILVNCAGAPGGKANGPIEQVDPLLLIEDVNEKYAGYLRAAKAAVPSMKQHGFGRLIHLGGLSSRMSGTYSAGGRNVAITHLSKTLADELGGFGITSNVVHPASTRSPWMTRKLAADAAERGTTPEALEAELAAGYAIGRLPESEEIAHIVTFLASPRSAAITGESISAGGGAGRGVSF